MKELNRFSVSRLVLMSLVLVGATAANAGVIFDTGVGTDYTSRAAGSGPGQGISVATTTTLTQIGFYAAAPDGANVKYLIWDGTNSTLLFSQTDYLSASGSPSLVLSDPFSFTLTAGDSYYFGIIGDSNIEVDYIYPQLSLTQNGLSTLTSGNSNYSDFSNPVLDGSGAATIALQLTSGAAPIPEPGTMALFGLGLVGMLGAVWRRKSVGVRAN